jgi:hypothetical protein
MSDSILKVKSMTNQAFAKSENENNVYSSSDLLDLSKIFSSDKEQSPQPNIQASHLATPKIAELNYKIMMNSRRAFEFINQKRKKPLNSDLTSITDDDDQKIMPVSEKNPRPLLNRTAIERNTNFHQPTTSKNVTSEKQVPSSQINMRETCREKLYGNKEKSRTFSMGKIEPLTMTELMSDPTVKIMNVRVGPKFFWKNDFNLTNIK